MTTIKKILALPAYVSSLAYAGIRPGRVDWWDRKYDLDQMYGRAYVFGAVVWIAVAGLAALALT
jgi:hypothetical protein